MHHWPRAVIIFAFCQPTFKTRSSVLTVHAARSCGVLPCACKGLCFLHLAAEAAARWPTEAQFMPRTFLLLYIWTEANLEQTNGAAAEIVRCMGGDTLLSHPIPLLHGALLDKIKYCARDRLAPWCLHMHPIPAHIIMHAQPQWSYSILHAACSVSPCDVETLIYTKLNTHTGI